MPSSKLLDSAQKKHSGWLAAAACRRPRRQGGGAGLTHSPRVGRPRCERRLDPWGYGGVGYSDDASGGGGGNRSNVIWIEHAAHHLDLRWCA